MPAEQISKREKIEEYCGILTIRRVFNFPKHRTWGGDSAGIFGSVRYQIALYRLKTVFNRLRSLQTLIIPYLPCK
jgi:hypothetical protein